MKRVVSIGVVVALAAGCGGGEKAPAGGEGGAPAAAAAAPLGNASISGTIAFTGAVPPNPTIDMSEEPACAAKHAGGATDPVVVVSDGKLANVFVYVKSGLPADASFQAPATPVEIDQQGCLYHPRVLGLMVGQDLLIKNGDPLLHNIKAVPTENRGFNISQPSEGMTSTRSFSTPEVMVPIECNVHGWMHAWVGVRPDPYFAVSAEDGTFTITGLPAGTYEVEAWHETFGTKTMTVTVPADGQATADFSFSPAA